MANISLQRIQRDYKEVTKADDALLTGIKVRIFGDDLYKLQGEITGPPDSPYEGGTYLIDVTIPDTYPFHPPKMKFITKIWHPNISSQTGAICLDILKDQWAASMTLRTIFLSLQALLSAPAPDDPQDAVVAKQCLENPEMFVKTAKHWCQKFAGSGTNDSNSEFVRKISQLCEMGVEEHQARVALSSNNWDVGRATEFIFS